MRDVIGPGKRLRVLLVEDREDDALLVLRELVRGGYEVTHERVETPEGMRDALTRQDWDIVLSDYSMPTFSGPAALEVMKGLGKDLPFIIVSGTVGEDAAVEAMHAGAHDFMSKGRLGRLIPAIERELRDVALRAEKTKMQDQLLIADRMVSMGTLAAGVAHEINNPLACVLANLELAAREIGELGNRPDLRLDLAEVRDELHDAREAVGRIRNIVRDLKIFSRSHDETTGPVDVHAVMESTLRMAWNEIRHRARLVKTYGQIPSVEATESRLGQVFLNLIVNAAQAIPEGRAEANQIRITTSFHPPKGVIIEISDSGTGMTAETVSHLFTPFFTTKPVGVGTGLGLSICHRIVSGFGGTIEVESQVGSGTLFRITLAPSAGTAIALPWVSASTQAARRRGRVLVVDDEPMIAKAVQRALAEEHDVEAVRGGGEALRRIKGGERFDVILCDLMMPQMTGMEFHAELVRAANEQAERVVFLTGGAFTSTARAFLEDSPIHRIEKPFDTEQLRALVNSRVG